ncbi:MAG: GWxTD domain-containing protein [Rhizobacter sp.]|nr:GWxTD domain-containing protein [Chlorobiales bacterium]
MLLAQNSLDSLGRRTITPLVSAPVLQSKEGARFFFEIYADSITRGPLIAQYTIRSVGKKAEDVDVQRHRVIVDQKRVQVFDNVNLEKVSSGDYVVKVSLIDSAGRFFTEAERPLQVRAAGLVSYIRDLDKAVEQLLYAATSEEISRITEVKTESDRLARFNEFWKKRDPTPKSPENELMAEYYSRIEYANQNFSHYIEGWKTDMGMIFIKYGQPDFVDRRPFNFDTKPYEIWEFYQKNRRFTFVDETGFGDYRLTRPEWDMRNRLR